MIPRVIHRIVLGPDAPPRELANLARDWRRAHPAWTLHEWTEATIPPNLRAEIYEHLRSVDERRELLALELLRREGGVCVDARLACLCPIDELVAAGGFVAAVRDGLAWTALLASEPEHPLVTCALEHAEPRAWYGERGERLAELLTELAATVDRSALAVVDSYVELRDDPRETNGFATAAALAAQRLEAAERALSRARRTHDRLRNRLPD